MDNLSEQIKSLRNEYSDLDLLLEDLSKNPIQQFRKWLDEAIETKIYEPNAMVLATSNNEMPRSRYVLFKNIIEDKIIFHTHYESPKALEIFSNPKNSSSSFVSNITLSSSKESPSVIILGVDLGGNSTYMSFSICSSSRLLNGLRKAISLISSGTFAHAFGPVYFIEVCPRLETGLGSI